MSLKFFHRSCLELSWLLAIWHTSSGDWLNYNVTLLSKLIIQMPKPGSLINVLFLNSDYTNNRDEHRFRFTGNELRSLWREFFLMGVSTICFVVSVINLFMYVRSLEFYWKSQNAVYVRETEHSWISGQEHVAYYCDCQ